MVMNYQLIVGLIIIITIIYFTVKKDTFYNIETNDDDFYDFNKPHILNFNQKNGNVENVESVNEIKTYTNGAPGGANVNVSQNKYDLLFKDVLVSSEKRNHVKYPNPNNYYVHLNIKLDKIYKAELIDVYIPAATDESVNILSNRLYFTYTSGVTVVTGYVAIQPGTYMSPDSLAKELSRQFYIVLTAAGLVISKTVGVCVEYDKNLNRYLIKDKQYTIPATLIIYTQNGYIIDPNNTVTDSINNALMLDNQIYISGPKIIKYNNVLYVANAVPGDYGEFNGVNVPLNSDCAFSNCILSEVVLTHCKLYLSLGKLNGDTCNLTPDENGTDKNVPPVFCQVPNNTCVSSASVKTLLNQPHNFSAIQFYNPPISKVNKLEIKWYTEDGSLVRILDHCFTVRIYYFQKRIDTTDFSYPIP